MYFYLDDGYDVLNHQNESVPWTILSYVFRQLIPMISSCFTHLEPTYLVAIFVIAILNLGRFFYI